MRGGPTSDYYVSLVEDEIAHDGREAVRGIAYDDAFISVGPDELSNAFSGTVQVLGVA